MDRKLEGRIKKVIQTKGPTLFEINNVTVAAFIKPGERAYPELKEGIKISAIISDEEKPKLISYKIIKTELLTKTNIQELQADYEKLAQLISGSVNEGRPIIIHHDNDPDGLCAGIMMQNTLKEFNVVRRISRTPFYSLEDANKDFQLRNNALVIILDNGSSADNYEGVKRLSDLGMKIGIIDHHVIDERIIKIVDAHVNPRQVNLSHHYCTGILTYEFCNGIKKTANYAGIASIADHSTITSYVQDKDFDIAASLDYEIRVGRTESEIIIQKILEGELSHKETIDKIKNDILSKLKGKIIGKAIVYNLEEFTNKIYPTIGVIMNWLSQDKKDYFIVGVVGDIVSMRSDNTNLLELMQKHNLKGGGHEDRATVITKNIELIVS